MINQTTSESLHQLVFDRRLPYTAWEVYRALRHYKRKESQTCVPRIRQLHAYLGGRVSERTIQRNLRALEQLAFIVTMPDFVFRPDVKYDAGLHRGKQLSNIYRLTSEEERVQILKGRGEAAFLRPRSVTPRVTPRVTPYKYPRRTSQRTLPHDPLPTEGAKGAGPARPGRKDDHAGRAAGAAELSALLTFHRSLERRPGREPAALPPDAVHALEELLDRWGPARTMALLRTYRAADRDWSEWAADAGFPIGRLSDDAFAQRLMHDRAFGGLHTKYANQLAAETVQMMRRGQTAGQVLSALFSPGVDPPQDTS